MKITIILVVFFCQLMYSQTIYKDKPAPDLEFSQWLNNEKGMEVLNDKPIILEFWARWCGPCIKAFPHFNSLTEKYSNDIVFIAVNSFEDKDLVEKFLLKNHLSSFVALDKEKYLYNAFDIQNIPVTIIIDKDGMLRWRGITTELTEEILDKFLNKNIFHDTYNKGLILDENRSISVTKNIDYHLNIEYGDGTKGKSLSTDFEDRFYLKLSNYNIFSSLSSFSDMLKDVDEWQFDGNIPEENKIINVTIQAENPENKDAILEDAIGQLGEIFNFSIEHVEEIQEIWLIEPNLSQLDKHLSHDQNLDVRTKEKTEEYMKYENVFFPYLEFVIANVTKEKVIYNGKDFRKYNLTIPKIDNILEMKKILKQEYEIELVKKEIKVKINKAIFK